MCLGFPLCLGDGGSLRSQNAHLHLVLWSGESLYLFLEVLSSSTFLGFLIPTSFPKGTVGVFQARYYGHSFASGTMRLSSHGHSTLGR